MEKRHTTSHHPFNYLVLFIQKDFPVKKCLVNAKDKKNALRIGLNRLCRQYPTEDIARVRIGGVYPAEVRTIKKRIV